VRAAHAVPRTMTEREAVAALRHDDSAVAGRAAAALWTMWCTVDDPELAALLEAGTAAMARGDFATAERRFTELIERAPAYAEGWNKRATVRYLAGRYAESIADCRETLTRKPHHFGALSGQGLCHMALGENAEAVTLFRRTLVVYPHLEAARRNLRLAISEVVKAN
jgi:Flp pilus assembly protein TadD